MRHRIRCLIASKPMAPSLRASRTAAWTSSSGNVSRRRSSWTYSRLPCLPMRLHQASQGSEGFGQIPTLQGGSLVEGPDLALQQREVVQRVEDEVRVSIGARMPGDDLSSTADHDLID